MTTKVNNEYGCIEIDKHVIAQIAYRAAMESYGLVGFSQKIKGIVELLKGDNATKGVKIYETEDNKIEIELFVIMQYGINISTVANNIIERVKYSVENTTLLHQLNQINTILLVLSDKLMITHN